MQPDASLRLSQGLAGAGLTATADQISKWLTFLELLYRWNRVHSLTSVPLERAAVGSAAVGGAAVERHLMDALLVWPHLAQALEMPREGAARQILDVGSGTGVPGIPLAIALPGTQWLLVERVARKAAFLRQAVARLGLSDRVAVAQTDVRDLTAPAGYEIILSRAFAALPRFIEWTQHLAHAQTRWGYLAGRLEHIPELESSPQGGLHGPEPGQEGVLEVRMAEGVLGRAGDGRRRVIQALALTPQGDRHLVWVSMLPERGWSMG